MNNTDFSDRVFRTCSAVEELEIAIRSNDVIFEADYRSSEQSMELYFSVFLLFQINKIVSHMRIEMCRFEVNFDATWVERSYLS